MPETTRRKFGIADAMILVAGVAVSVGWEIYLDTPIPRSHINPHGDFRHPLGDFGPLSVVYYAVRDHDVFILLPAMIALAAIGLRLRPRDELATRPGVVALLVGVVAGMAGALVNLLGIVYLYAAESYRGSDHQPLDNRDLTWLIWSKPHVMGISIGLVWLYMRLSGRWEARKDWLDRAGRAIGFYWIITLFLPRI